MKIDPTVSDVEDVVEVGAYQSWRSCQSRWNFHLAALGWPRCVGCVVVAFVAREEDVVNKDSYKALV